MNIVICIFIALSLFFAFAGVVGMLRMPDTYSRMQVSTCISTCISAYLNYSSSTAS